MHYANSAYLLDKFIREGSITNEWGYTIKYNTLNYKYKYILREKLSELLEEQ